MALIVLRFWGVFWVDVSSTTLAKTDFLSIADRIDAPAETVDQVLGVLANTIQPWLMVLDNADDLSFDYQQYIPSGNRGFVLLTSSNKTCHKFSTLEPIILDHLGYADAKKLLFDTCGTPDELREGLDSAATKVLNLFDCHTLAVIQAGSFIQNGFATLEEYPKEYNRHREKVMSYHDSQSQSRYSHVYATFESSVENLARRRDPVSADALDLLLCSQCLHVRRFHPSFSKLVGLVRNWRKSMILAMVCFNFHLISLTVSPAFSIVQLKHGKLAG
jgi:hypothetical protein